MRPDYRPDPSDSGPVRRHPLIGDGKYGSERENRKYGRHGQALYSYKLTFRFTTDAGPLETLNGRSFQVEDVEFVKEYFPGVEK